MKRKEFIKIVTDAMEMIETGNERYSCNAIFHAQKGNAKTVECDYVEVFGDRDDLGYCIRIGFGICMYYTEKIEQARLNALAMYLAQSLAFKTYKEL